MWYSTDIEEIQKGMLSSAIEFKAGTISSAGARSERALGTVCLHSLHYIPMVGFKK
jgi:hypothetical protein